MYKNRIASYANLKTITHRVVSAKNALEVFTHSKCVMDRRTKLKQPKKIWQRQQSFSWGWLVRIDLTRVYFWNPEDDSLPAMFASLPLDGAACTTLSWAFARLHHQRAIHFIKCPRMQMPEQWFQCRNPCVFHKILISNMLWYLEGLVFSESWFSVHAKIAVLLSSLMTINRRNGALVVYSEIDYMFLICWFPVKPAI